MYTLQVNYNPWSLFKIYGLPCIATVSLTARIEDTNIKGVAFTGNISFVISVEWKNAT